jgi:hypothetical protein
MRRWKRTLVTLLALFLPPLIVPRSRSSTAHRNEPETPSQSSDAGLPPSAESLRCCTTGEVEARSSSLCGVKVRLWIEIVWRCRTRRCEVERGGTRVSRRSSRLAREQPKAYFHAGYRMVSSFRGLSLRRDHRVGGDGEGRWASRKHFLCCASQILLNSFSLNSIEKRRIHDDHYKSMVSEILRVLYVL